MRGTGRLLTETQSRANGPLSGKKKLLLMQLKEESEKHATAAENRGIRKREMGR